MHHDDKINKTTKKRRKPEIITFNNKSPGGVDTAEQMCAQYTRTVARNTRRWTMVIFYGILNVAGVNTARICYSQKDQIESSR